MFVSQVEDRIEDAIMKEVKNFQAHGSQPANRIIQEIQKTFKCCGTKGYKDYGSPKVPASCCGQTDFNKDYTDTCDISGVQYNDGCGTKVKDTLVKYLGSLGGVAIGLILVQLLIILSACCLSREVRN